ncbi:MAG: OmpA family protein [Bacteroidales bacterium]|nr:OmpA family protein [Bacteroidales bacterium]
MMKRILPIAIALAFAIGGMAQNKMADPYREQYVKLYREYAKNADNVANLIALADFFSIAENPQYDLPLATEYIVHAEKLYTEWVQDPKRFHDVQKLIRKGVTITTIRQQKKDIEARAVQYVTLHAADMGQHQTQAYLQAYAGNTTIVRLLRSKELAEAYEHACSENTLAGYYHFLKRYPGTVEADSAEMSIAKMAPGYLSSFATEEAVDTALAPFSESVAMQRAAMQQKSRMAYGNACRKNTVQAYDEYMEKYPRGEDYLAAFEKKELLAANGITQLRTVKELADYAEQHDDATSDSALAILRRMVLEEHNQAAAREYLKRFPLDEAYPMVFRTYYSWHAAEGNRQPIAQFAADYPNYPDRLTIESDLARGEMIDRFNLNKTFVESELDTMTTILHLLTGRKVAYVALQRVIQQQLARKDWASAKKRMQKFEICFEDYCVEEYKELDALLSNNGGPALTLQFSGDSISHVIPHPKHAILYYTRQQNGRKDIAYARHTKNGWKTAGVVNVQGTNDEVVAYNFYDKGDKVLLGIGGDIWSAQVLSDSVWKVVSVFPSPVNTAFLERDAFMLQDGSGMLLASDRPLGHNVQQSGSNYHGSRMPATDIYYIPYHQGRWGAAVNLGLSVNTPYCELSPILSRNMRTLYFITDSRGLGYGDVYQTTRTDIDDWTHWSKPVNVGRNVNGPYHESSVAFGGNERQVVLTSNHPHGRYVYTFPTQHDTTAPYRYIEVNMSASIHALRTVDLVEVWRQQKSMRFADRAIDTSMSFHLYKDKQYALVADADWLYVPTLMIEDADTGVFALKGYSLGELRLMDSAVALPLVNFVGTSSQLEPLAEFELNHLGRFLQQRTHSQIEISVYVAGTDERQCYDLSLERAKAVRSYLEDYGVASGRIHVAAYGNAKLPRLKGGSSVEVRFL